MQNAVLAGVVVVRWYNSEYVDPSHQPWGAILLGTLAGIISVCGRYSVQVHSSHDAGHSKLKIVLLHDTIKGYSFVCPGNNTF